jgi:hypothetical protein
MHECATCGLEHEDAITEAAPEPVVVDPGPNEHDVEIAAIQADTAVKVAKIETEQRDDDLRAEVEELRGEMRGMREVLDRLAPPAAAEPEPVVVPVPEPAPAPEPEAATPPEAEHRKPPAPKRGFF